MPPERISKVLAAAGVASRRGADELVTAGRVRVDGRPAVLGERVDPETQQIEVDRIARSARRRRRPIYLALHKPPGVTSTVRDRHAATTVVDLVPPELVRGARLYPVGRLDQDSEGLILLTNDGDWAEHVLHPRYGVEREYAVALARTLNRDQAEALEGGVELAEGVATLGGAAGPDADRGPAPGRPARAAARPAGWSGSGARSTRAGSASCGGCSRGRRPGAAARPGPDRDAAPRHAGGGRRPGADHGRGAAPRPSARRPLIAATLPTAILSGMPSRSGQSTRRIVVALDGPASSGKSSVGAAAAEQLQLRFVDTGLFYRALTALALLEGVDLDDPAVLVPLVDRVSLGDDGSGRFTRVLLDGSDATEEARSALVDGSVSTVARVPEVRAALLERQRELAADGGIVMAGRDVGTVVLPDADLKLFLDASVEERARRRIDERGLDPDGAEAEEVREQLRARDAIDTGREVAPLRAADDAVHVLTDGNAFDETVEIVAAEIAGVMLTPRPRTRTRKAPVAAQVAAEEVVVGADVAEVPEPEAEPAPKPKRTRAPKAAAAAARCSEAQARAQAEGRPRAGAGSRG